MADSNVAAICTIMADGGLEALISKEPALPSFDKSLSKIFTGDQKQYRTGDTIEYRIEDQPQMPKQQTAYWDDPVVQNKLSLQILNWEAGGFSMSDMEEMFYYGGADMVKKMIVDPRVEGLGTQANILGYNIMAGAPLFSGVVNQDASNFLTWAQAKAAMISQLCPTEKIYGVMDPFTKAMLADNVKNAFTPSKIADVAYLDGDVKELGGINFFESPNLPTQVNGSAVANGKSGMVIGTNSVSGATSFAVTGGTSAGTVLINSILYMPGIYEVNPQTRAPIIGRNMGWQVTESMQLSSGAGTIKVFPAIVGPEDPKNQTCSKLPTTANYVAILGSEVTGSLSYNQAFTYSGPAIKFVSAKLEELQALVNVYSNPEAPLSVRAVHGGDIYNSRNVTRLDCLMAAGIGRWQHIRRMYVRSNA